VADKLHSHRRGLVSSCQAEWAFWYWEIACHFDFIGHGQVLLSCAFSGQGHDVLVTSIQICTSIGIPGACVLLGWPRREDIIMIKSMMGPQSPSFLSTHD
jgi:hypothetical protein